MSGSLGACAGGAGLAVVPDKESESGPGVLAEDEGLRLVLTPVASSQVIVIRPEYVETEVPGVQNVHPVAELQESILIVGLA